MKFEDQHSGVYFYPDQPAAQTVQLAEEEFIGKYGRMREKYLKENEPVLYVDLLMSGKLRHHLAETQRLAEERLEILPEIFENIYPMPDKNDKEAWEEYREFISAKIEKGIQETLVER